MYKYLIVTLVSACSMNCQLTVDQTSISTSAVVNIDGMSPARITENRETLTQIVLDRIAIESQLSDAANAMASTPSGAELLSFVVSCAMPADTTLTSDTGIEFFGETGLASEWLNGPLNLKHQRWVTACILARTNGLGIDVVFSMRGPNGALKANSDERAAFPTEEGAFYGDIFIQANQPVDWVACRGRGTNTGNRICTKEDPSHIGFTQCGFKFAGNCQDVCESFDYGKYEECRDGDHVIDEVITTWDF